MAAPPVGMKRFYLVLGVVAVIGLAVSLVLTKFSGFTRMTSQQEGA